MNRALCVLAAIIIILSTVGCAGTGTNEKDPYEKIDEKLLKYRNDGDHTAAKRLLDENEWYTVKDPETAWAILDSLGDTISLYNTWEEVVDRIDGSIDPEINERKNEIYYSLGMNYLNTKWHDPVEFWWKCTEGSIGYEYYQGISKMRNGEALEGGKILNGAIGDEELRKSFIEYYKKNLDLIQVQDLNDYMEHVLGVAWMVGIEPAQTIDQITIPNGNYGPSANLHIDGTLNSKNYDNDMFEHLAMPEEMRADLPGALSGATGNKILVLNRVDICAGNRTELYINGYLMRSMPEEYCAESLQDVGYVILLDYGYLKEGSFYAGTATVRVYDIKTGEEIYTSEKMQGQFEQFYFGEQTNVIFGTYPGVGLKFREAMAVIK